MSYADKQLYRSAQLQSIELPTSVQFTKNKFTLITPNNSAEGSTTKRRNYVLINRRYLLLCGLVMSTGVVWQAGLTPDGYLVLHSSNVLERKVAGKYFICQTVVNQLILERQ